MEYILKVNLNEFADDLDVDYERKRKNQGYFLVFGLSNWGEGIISEEKTEEWSRNKNIGLGCVKLEMFIRYPSAKSGTQEKVRTRHINFKVMGPAEIT